MYFCGQKGYNEVYGKITCGLIFMMRVVAFTATLELTVVDGNVVAQTLIIRYDRHA